MRESSVNSSLTPYKPRPTSCLRSPISQKRSAAPSHTVSKLRKPLTPTPNRTKPRSSQSVDFSLNTSKMFEQAEFGASKFSPLAVPSPGFDVHACRSEIARLEADLNNSLLFEHKLMRDDWRRAKRSLDQQTLIEIQQHCNFNNQLSANFESLRQLKAKEEKVRDRIRKEEDFQARKEAKLMMEIEMRKQRSDDLEREKERFLINQEVCRGRKQVMKTENQDSRDSFREFVGAVKQRKRTEQLREIREREFEYAQGLGAKWIRLNAESQHVKENIEIVAKMIKK
jgi:hypothetical protein